MARAALEQPQRRPSTLDPVKVMAKGTLLGGFPQEFDPKVALIALITSQRPGKAGQELCDFVTEARMIESRARFDRLTDPEENFFFQDAKLFSVPNDLLKECAQERKAQDPHTVRAGSSLDPAVRNRLVGGARL